MCRRESTEAFKITLHALNTKTYKHSNTNQKSNNTICYFYDERNKKHSFVFF